MAIQNRRGPYRKLDTRKLRSGEYAVVLQDDPFCADGKSVYICFEAGNTKRMSTFEDMQENIKLITDEIEQKYTEEIKTVTKNAADITAHIQEKLDNGDFVGERGDSGVITPITGTFTLSGDAEGNLWGYYLEESVPPQFEVDSDGNIYLIIADE